MQAKDYPVTFGYLAYGSAGYTPENPHLGEDRKMPIRTPILINGVLVGYAGTTGKSTGVHTHTQRVYGNYVVNPQGGGFEVPQPTVVTAKGYREDIGYYVRYKDGDNFIWSKFHMDSPAVVRIGDILIKEDEEMSTVGEVEFNNLYRAFFGPMEVNPPTADDRKRWIGAETNTAIRQFEADPRHSAWLEYIEDLKQTNPEPVQFVPYTGNQLFNKIEEK